jgi:hypothetical protein
LVQPIPAAWKDVVDEALRVARNDGSAVGALPAISRAINRFCWTAWDSRECADARGNRAAGRAGDYGLIGNGIDIDTTIAAGFAGNPGWVGTDLETTVPNPSRKLHPLRVGRALVGEQLGHACEQAFVSDEKHIRNCGAGTGQSPANGAEVVGSMRASK